MMAEERYFINGVSGVTGDYLDPSSTIEDMSERAEKPVDATRSRVMMARLRTYGVNFDVCETEPESAGWALVVPETDGPRLTDALAPLVEHRMYQGGARVKVLEYRAGETRAQWLSRYGAAAGNIDPDRVPYYLLVAGDSLRLPFALMHELAVEYAVGRVEFDSLDDYRSYAENIIAWETTPSPAHAPVTAFFAPKHDQATHLSAEYLVRPLSDPSDTKAAVAKLKGPVSVDIGESATKKRLAELLGERHPSLLFTASHGVAWPSGHQDQRDRQGALLCQGWSPGAISDSDYFAAQDLPGVRLDGMITFHFACYGAGTPEFDRFPSSRATAPPRIANAPFIAPLAKSLLRSGALACAGHIERAWGWSIVPGENQQAQIGPFNNFLGFVLSGRPVGHAMRDFAARYAAMTVSLADILEKKEWQKVSPAILAELWTQRNDAGAYLVVGDPAVRLRHAQSRA